MVMKISTKGIKPKYVHWMSLQAKCHRCGCTATIYIWMVAGGMQIQTGQLRKEFRKFPF